MRKLILVVDDSPAFRYTVRRWLENVADLQVCGEAADGEEAVEKASQLSPDLIVMDLSMPKMNGLDAARLVKRQSPSVPIILYTLHKNALRQCDAESAGISVVVDKSNGVDSLLSEIQSLLHISCS
jgi:DNA-binding NarL/FixJ family response regulator